MSDTGKPEWAMSARERRMAEAAGTADPTADSAAAPRRSRRKGALILTVLVGLGVLVSVSYGWSAKSKMDGAVTTAATAAPVTQLIASEVQTVTPQLLQETVRVVGALAPRQQATLAAEVSGVIQTIPVRPGDVVAKGDTLVEIDTESLAVQLAQQRSTAAATRAQLVQAESQLERAQRMSERELLASSSLEEVESKAAALRANLEALEAQVANAEIAMRNATIVAPFSGIVSQRSVEPGQLVSAGTQMISVVDLSTLEFEATAPAAAATRIVPGQKVRITVGGLADQSFEGVVDRINPVTAQGTRSIPVYITLDNSGGLLRGGMFASGEIVIDESPDAVAVPVTALRDDATGPHVLKLENGQTVRADVEPVRRWNGDRLVEIRSGLSAGDIILSAALPEVTPDQTVRLIDTGTPDQGGS